MQISEDFEGKIGIYSIINTLNSKRYIGSSIDIRKRLQKHRALLRGNTHPNPVLQNSWNKYGEESFQCSILETCEEVDLLILEQRYIDLSGDFNIYKEALRPKHTIEMRLKQSETRRRLFKEKKIKIGCSKVTLQYNIYGELIKRWDDVRECITTLEIPQTTMYRSFYKENSKYNLVVKGFIFIREGIDELDINNLLIPSITDLENNTIYIGNNYRDIMKHLNIRFQLSNLKKKIHKKKYFSRLVNPRTIKNENLKIVEVW